MGRSAGGKQPQRGGSGSSVTATGRGGPASARTTKKHGESEGSGGRGAAEAAGAGAVEAAAGQAVTGAGPHVSRAHKTNVALGSARANMYAHLDQGDSDESEERSGSPSPSSAAGAGAATTAPGGASNSSMSSPPRMVAAGATAPTTPLMHSPNGWMAPAPGGGITGFVPAILGGPKPSMVVTHKEHLFSDTKVAPAVKLYKPLVWIDLEMTGLDTSVHTILEAAVIITDGKLRRAIEGPDLVIHHDEETLATMNDWSKEHHGASGLTEASRRSTISLQEAESQILEFVAQYTIPAKAILAGNSIACDRKFIDKHMPRLAAHFSHRMVDVSSLSELCFRWFPNLSSMFPAKKSGHRALDDIRNSISQLKWYQQNLFIQTDIQPVLMSEHH